MKRAIVAGALASAALSVQLPAQTNANPGAVEAGDYTIDGDHTQVGFAVSHFGINDYFGIMPNATGTLTIDPSDLAAAKLLVTLPVSSLSTTNVKLDQQLVGPEWFDAGKFPTINFVSTKVVRTGKDSATISGNLTMHGITRPFVLNANFQAAGINPLRKVYTIGFKAKGVVKRSEFGVSKFVPMIGDDVTLTITAAFEKKAG